MGGGLHILVLVSVFGCSLHICVLRSINTLLRTEGKRGRTKVFAALASRFPLVAFDSTCLACEASRPDFRFLCSDSLLSYVAIPNSDVSLGPCLGCLQVHGSPPTAPYEVAIMTPTPRYLPPRAPNSEKNVRRDELDANDQDGLR